MWNKSATFHIGSWLLWLISAMTGALFTHNPYYLAAITLCAVVVSRSFSRAGGGTGRLQTQGNFSGTGDHRMSIFYRAMLVILVLTALIKALSLHLGTTVLFRIPQEWPVVGGTVTLEGMTFAFLEAFSIVTILAVFTAFSAGADYYAMLRAVPPALHQAGLITSIAITFIPETATRFTEIREAQALRGHRIRRIGDLIPVIIPLLSGGMERSMSLAEAMEARGFSQRQAKASRLSPVLVQSGIILGLGLILMGAALQAFLPASNLLWWGLIIAGVTLFGVILRAAGHGTGKTRYRRAIWRETDTTLALVSSGITAILVIYRFIAPSTLLYDPLSSLRIHPPIVDPVLLTSLLALASPALIMRPQRKEVITTAQASERKVVAP